MDRLTEYLFPKQVSTFAADIDNLFYFIFYSSIVLFAIVVLGMMYLAIKYRFKKGDEVRLTSSKDHSNILEALFLEGSLYGTINLIVQMTLLLHHSLLSHIQMEHMFMMLQDFKPYIV